ncbi:MAG TPA: DinB family protein [Mycobacteriales bacterium]|jgi:hypothetical protein|nr:DinB family protein [Mycobacteriales bacterium]
MAIAAPPDTRTWPATVGAERDLLTQLLDYHRETLAWKCAGLTDEQLRARPIATTTLSLLGLVRHLTEVDRDRFSEFFGDPPVPIYCTDAAPEADLEETGSVPVAEVFSRWRDEAGRIRQGLAAVPLDARITDPRGRSYSLRWNYLHVIEEYARHNGHADLLREAIDGVTGE